MKKVILKDMYKVEMDMHRSYVKSSEHSEESGNY